MITGRTCQIGIVSVVGRSMLELALARSRTAGLVTLPMTVNSKCNNQVNIKPCVSAIYLPQVSASKPEERASVCILQPDSAAQNFDLVANIYQYPNPQ